MTDLAVHPLQCLLRRLELLEDRTTPSAFLVKDINTTWGYDNSYNESAYQGVTIAGNLKDMLNSIEMIGNDLDFRGSVVAPTLLIGGMTIGA